MRTKKLVRGLAKPLRVRMLVRGLTKPLRVRISHIADCLLPASYLRAFTCVRILIPLRSFFFFVLFFAISLFSGVPFFFLCIVFFPFRSGSVVCLPRVACLAFFPTASLFLFFFSFFPSIFSPCLAVSLHVCPGACARSTSHLRCKQKKKSRSAKSRANEAASSLPCWHWFF